LTQLRSPGIPALVAYMGAGLPFFITWLIVSRIHPLISIPAIVSYVLLMGWILLRRASHSEPIKDNIHTHVSNPKDNSGALMVLHFLAATAFCLFIWILYPAILHLAQSKGYIYAFSIPTLSSWGWFFTILLSWFYLFALPIYTSRSHRSPRFSFIIIVIGIYFLVCLFLYSTSYGHIHEKGINYRSIQTRFRIEAILWSNITAPVRLDVVYWPKNKRWTYFYYLYVPSIQGSSLPLKIQFEENPRDKDSLLLILRILNQNHIPVQVNIADTTKNMVGKDKNLDLFLMKVDNIKSGKE
jgi:hypothetical protein